MYITRGRAAAAMDSVEALDISTMTAGWVMLCVLRASTEDE